MEKKEPTLRERALFLISPKRGNEAYRKRMAELQAGRDASTRMAATGYGNHGASTTLNSMIGWIAGGGSAPCRSMSSSALPPPAIQPIMLFSVVLAPWLP